ncbi:hypothetical protein ABBQ38_006873 [Trebouxia sp. C0009 RCD-2024]
MDQLSQPTSLLAIGTQSRLPPVLLHRFDDTLRVNNRLNQGVNDVRTQFKDGVCWALKAEPVSGKVPVGVSFLDIRRPYLQHQHNYHYKAKYGQCYTTEPSGFLPAGIAMLQDTLLRFPPLRQNAERLDQGQHFSLYPTEDMPLTDFEQKVMQTRHLICDFKAEAEPLDISDPAWPSDVRMCNIVVALNISSETCDKPNTAILAWAYSHHIGCTDMAYPALLADTGILPSLAAAAMEQRPQPNTVQEIDMCNDIKMDLGRTLRYTPTLYGEVVCHVSM